MYAILPLTAASGTVGHSKISFPSNMQQSEELFKYTYLKHYKIRGIFHHVLDICCPTWSLCGAVTLILRVFLSQLLLPGVQVKAVFNHDQYTGLWEHQPFFLL